MNIFTEFSLFFCMQQSIILSRILFDRKINPSENRLVAFLACGEGWHNYHHVFPWDYKAAELGDYKLNITTMYIDLFAKIGWAYDLKQPSKEIVKSVVMKRGDGSHWGAASYANNKIA